MTPEVLRRLRQNVAAIEKDLNLSPKVSKQIGGAIHTEETEQSATQDSIRPHAVNTVNRIDFYGRDQEGDSPEFPKRESNDEVHRAEG